MDEPSDSGSRPNTTITYGMSRRLTISSPGEKFLIMKGPNNQIKCLPFFNKEKLLIALPVEK